jgi:hypothetical protein
MIRHDAVRKYSHGALSLGPHHKLEKILVLARSFEKQTPIVPAIHAMDDRTSWQIS